MKVINHEEVTGNLYDGSDVTFSSISNQLDPAKPLEDQMDYVPRGLWIIMLGHDEKENPIQNTVSWNFGGSEYCQSVPLSDGDIIGLLEIVSHC